MTGSPRFKREVTILVGQLQELPTEKVLPGFLGNSGELMDVELEQFERKAERGEREMGEARGTAPGKSESGNERSWTRGRTPLKKGLA